MGGSIEMDGVHDVLETFERTVGHQMDVLVPVWTAHQHNIVGVVLADFTNDLSGIALDGRPCVLDRFVVYLVDDVRILAVLLRHLAKELLGLSGVHVVGVPVDDDVDVLFDGTLDDRRQT